MTTDFRALCAKVLAYNEGQGSYNFSHLNGYDRDNAAFDAWQEIKAELKSALAEPEPEGPTVMQIIELADEIKAVGLGQVDLVRAALARWGRPTPQPVPVSERLPGPEDCDGEGKCWWFHDEDNASCSHWLPAHALSIPTAND